MFNAGAHFLKTIFNSIDLPTISDFTLDRNRTAPGDDVLQLLLGLALGIDGHRERSQAEIFINFAFDGFLEVLRGIFEGGNCSATRANHYCFELRAIAARTRSHRGRMGLLKIAGHPHIPIVRSFRKTSLPDNPETTAPAASGVLRIPRQSPQPRRARSHAHRGSEPELGARQAAGEPPAPPAINGITTGSIRSRSRP